MAVNLPPKSVSGMIRPLQRYMDEQQLSSRRVAVLFCIRNPESVRRWKQQYDSGGLEALASRQKRPLMTSPKMTPTPKSTPEKTSPTREELLAEVEYLRMENAYLKKLDALIQADQLAAQRKKRK